jgi:prepilin-type N-terminal cleavage/methylation domain-containing protein
MRIEMSCAVSYRRRRGFTLLEILVVVAIIAILVTLLVLVAGAVKNKALVSQTNTTLDGLRNVMGQYMKDGYPEPSGNPADWPYKLLADAGIAKNVTVSKGYVAGNPPQFLDAWGHPISYLPSKNSPGPNPPVTPQGWVPKDQGYFWSWGPDGQPYTPSGPNANKNDDLLSDGVAP